MSTAKVEQKGIAILSLSNFGKSSHFDVVERRLRKVPGIVGATVDYVAKVVVVDYDPSQVTIDQVRCTIARLTREVER